MIRRALSILIICISLVVPIIGLPAPHVQTLSYHLTPSAPLVIDSNEDLRLISGRGNGFADSPFVIENLVIQGTANVTCIEITDTTDYFIIQNCLLANSSQFGFGIRMNNVRNGVIESCTIENCTIAVTMNDCRSIRVEDCEFTDNVAGFSVTRCIACTLLGNWIYNSRQQGVYGQGIWIGECTDTWIEGNCISGHDIAVFSNNAAGLVVRNNTIVSNSYGFQLFGCYYWEIYNNSIGWNDISAVVGFGYRNYWNSSYLGNSWSDYDGVGAYVIDVFNVDYMPSTMKTSIPSIGEPQHVEVVMGDPAGVLEWDVYDPYPLRYSISNGTHIVQEGYWNGRNIALGLSGLQPSTYSFTLTVTNLFGVTKTVNGVVVVLTPSPQPVFFIPALIASPVLLITAVFLVYRTRNKKSKRKVEARTIGIMVMAGYLAFAIVLHTLASESNTWFWANRIFSEWALIVSTGVDIVGTVGLFYRWLGPPQDTTYELMEATIPEETRRQLSVFERRVAKSLRQIYSNLCPEGISAANLPPHVSLDNPELRAPNLERHSQMLELLSDLSKSARTLLLQYKNLTGTLPIILSKDELYRIARQSESLARLSSNLSSYPSLRMLVWDYLSFDQRRFHVGIDSKAGYDLRAWPLEEVYYRNLRSSAGIPVGWTMRAYYLREFERAIEELVQGLESSLNSIGYLAPLKPGRNLQVLCETETDNRDLHRDLVGVNDSRVECRQHYVSLLIRNGEVVAAQNCIAKIDVWNADNRVLVSDARLGWKSRGSEDAVNPMTIGAGSQELLNICLGDECTSPLFTFTTEKMYQGFGLPLNPGMYFARVIIVADHFESAMHTYKVVKESGYREITVSPMGDDRWPNKESTSDKTDSS